MTPMPSGLRLPAAALGLVASAMSACAPRLEAPRDADAPLPVAIAVVTMADQPAVLDVGGIVQARATAHVTSRILAPVREVRVAPGDRVRAGDVLVVLDADQLGAEARRARAAALASEQGERAAAAEVRAAEAARALARATHERIAGLAARRSATPQELDEARAALEAAEARVAAATARAREAASALDSVRAASDAATATEGFTRVTSPFDGVVTEKRVEPGNMAAPGVPLIVIDDTRGFRLDVRLDESRARHVALDATIPVLLGTDADANQTPVPGTVSEIARATDADARALLVKISLPTQANLRSGMFGRARVPGPPRRGLTVPAEAIVRRGQVTSVFVVERDVARVRLVNVSGTDVLSGLAEGDVVIVRPPADLTDGRRVRPGVRP
jgi:RND family efflux transporter MFP subunit